MALYLGSQDALELGVGSPPPQEADTEHPASNGKRKPATVRHLAQVGCTTQGCKCMLGQIKSLQTCSMAGRL